MWGWRRWEGKWHQPENNISMALWITASLMEIVWDLGKKRRKKYLLLLKWKSERTIRWTRSLGGFGHRVIHSASTLLDLKQEKQSKERVGVTQLLVLFNDSLVKTLSHQKRVPDFIDSPTFRGWNQYGLFPRREICSDFPSHTKGLQQAALNAPCSKIVYKWVLEWENKSQSFLS